jgi:hypothetical protein
VTNYMAVSKAAKARATGVKPVKQPVAKVAKPVASKAPSVQARIRGLIVDGLDNAAVWKTLNAEGLLDESKRWYPAWTRAKMARDAAKE